MNGGLVTVRLGSYPAPSRRLALRWLREQATRLADGLDPAPGTGWAPAGVLGLVSHQPTDVPAELRSWCADEAAQEAANDQLADGVPFCFSTADHGGRYLLEAWPVEVTTLHAPYMRDPGAPVEQGIAETF